MTTISESQYIVNEAKKLAEEIRAIRSELVKPGQGQVRTARMMLLQTDVNARQLVKSLQTYAKAEEDRVSQAVTAEKRRQEIAHFAHPEDRPGI